MFQPLLSDGRHTLLSMSEAVTKEAECRQTIAQDHSGLAPGLSYFVEDVLYRLRLREIAFEYQGRVIARALVGGSRYAGDLVSVGLEFTKGCCPNVATGAKQDRDSIGHIGIAIQMGFVWSLPASSMLDYV